MNADPQQHSFEIAYRTGSDVWTHIPYHHRALKVFPPLAKDALVLDVGAGRGLWLAKLVADGNRVIGLEYIHDLVTKGNADIKREGFADRARFVYGDVRDIPIADQSFDAITDIGVLQHLPQIDWPQYLTELRRVVKPGGYVLNVSLSKETPRFLGFKPKLSSESLFEKFGVQYYFFANNEIQDIFAQYGFGLLEQYVENFDAKTDPGDSLSLVFSLLKYVG